MFLQRPAVLVLALIWGSLPLAPTAASDAAIPPETCRLGLALGSGGASGLAHIEMLQAFDDLGLKPDRIAGTSIGAVIGALYAAGMDAASIRELFDQFGGSGLDALSRLVDGPDGLSIRSVLDLDLDEGGLVDPDGFLEFLAGHTEARTFDDLGIPLEVIATDYWTGESVVLDRGPLIDAVHASMAVPGLFSPVRDGDRLLIDGGTSNPLPSNRLMDRCEYVVAVDVSGARPRPGDEDEAGFTDLLFGSFELMQQALIVEMLRADPPDLYLKPEIRGVRLLHFNRIDRVLEQAAPAADRLKAYLVQLSDAAPEEPPS